MNWLAMAKIRTYAASVMGWKITTRDAIWRCCAMESAINLRAAILSSSSINCCVTRGGTPSRGSIVGTISPSTLEVIVAREDGKSSGRVCEEEGYRRGVEVFEFSVEGGSRTRFARKKLKKAVGKLELANGSCAKSTRTIILYT